MRYTWDKAKNAANIAKHHVDFAEAAEFFDGRVIVRADSRRNYGEKRFIAIGEIQGIVFSLVYTDRSSDERRIISLRRANQKERRTFQEAFEI